MRKREYHVLVADGDLAAVGTLSQDLADAGFQVVTVTSGADVVRECVVCPPDVLIMDVNLPDMDGFDVCSYVRSEYADLPMAVILLSDQDNELTRTSLSRMVDFVGGDCFFAKPLDTRLIVDLVDELATETPVGPAPAASSVLPPRATLPQEG